jgi:hypothetical protein
MKRVIGIVILVILAVSFLASLTISGRRIPTEKERECVYRVGFSHPMITERVGAVRNVSVALKKKASLFAKRPEDWTRIKSAEVITGTVRLWILGTTEGGFVTLTYSYRDGDDTISVIRLDTSALGTLPKTPNQALERNGYVRHASCVARVTPAIAVAHF